MLVAADRASAGCCCRPADQDGLVDPEGEFLAGLGGRPPCFKLLGKQGLSIPT